MKSQETDSLTEHCLSSKMIHEGRVIQLKLDEIRLPNGKTGKREVVLHNGGVVIIPQKPDGKLVLVEQYRYAIGQRLLEFPAGRLNLQEDPLKAALRELTEETGFKAGNIKKLGHIFTAPGFCSECLHIYLATDLQEGSPQPDEDEFVEMVILSPDQLKQKIYKAEITDAKTLAAWSLFQTQCI